MKKRVRKRGMRGIKRDMQAAGTDLRPCGGWDGGEDSRRKQKETDLGHHVPVEAKQEKMKD